MVNQIDYFRTNILPKYEGIVENKLKLEQLELQKKKMRLRDGYNCVMWHVTKGKLKEPKI